VSTKLRILEEEVLQCGIVVCRCLYAAGVISMFTGRPTFQQT
jgi:hypothetical protein